MKTNIVEIADTTVNRIFYRGEPVVTFAMVDELHERADGTARRNFNENRIRFDEGVDFEKVCADEIRTHKIMPLSSKAHGDIVLITRRGYLKLVKPMTDDRAWQVQGEMIDRYFIVEDLLAGKIVAPAPAIPSRFGDDLTTREKLSMIRETRLAHGVKAGRRMWAMMDFPDVTRGVKPGYAMSGREEALACLDYLSSREFDGQSIAHWCANREDTASMNRAGLRIFDDGLFVANATRIFYGSDWARGRHMAFLERIGGVFRMTRPVPPHREKLRGLWVPMAVIAGGFHA